MNILRKPAAPDPRDLSGFYATVRRSSRVQLAKYVLCPFGLALDSVGDVIVDHTIALVQPHAAGNICLCPLKGTPQPTESLAWYYADCIAYEHDIPVIVLPTAGDFERFSYRYAHSGQTTPKVLGIVDLNSGHTRYMTKRGLSAKKAVKAYYYDSLCTILENVREMRHGPLTYICFRHESRDGSTLDLTYTSKYSKVAQEIHLYAVGLRQADSLGEFLCYYRVIESATRSNGMAWIASSLDELPKHDFGYTAIAHEGIRTPRNLLSIWRRRALRRLSALRQTFGSPTEIARYLYGTNRCGIAHGKNIVRADITPSYFEVVRDTYLLKILARLAIDQKL